ncbi:pilS cassette [Neisseria meningitidis]|nr:pilS cassette [Neisseria meningitidis]
MPAKAENQKQKPQIPSFPRRRESRRKILKKPFYPIKFPHRQTRFPPARE